MERESNPSQALNVVENKEASEVFLQPTLRPIPRRCRISRQLFGMLTVAVTIQLTLIVSSPPFLKQRQC